MLYVHLNRKCILLFIYGASDSEDVLMHDLLKELGFSSVLTIKCYLACFHLLLCNNSKECPLAFSYKNKKFKKAGYRLMYMYILSD